MSQKPSTTRKAAAPKVEEAFHIVEHASAIEAFIALQAELENPAKTGEASIVDRNTGEERDYRHTELGPIMAAIRPAAARHGLAIHKNPISEHGEVGYFITLMHTSETKIEFDPIMIPAGSTAHERAAAWTLAARYNVQNAFNVYGDDDDDAAALRQRTRRVADPAPESRPTTRQARPAEPRKATVNQLRRITREKAELELTEADYAQLVRSVGGDPDADLNFDQASSLIDVFKPLLASKKGGTR